tara:strand:- start:139 stop:690 length:552 start_codon:yes stop_codon:yes gene_type:complete
MADWDKIISGAYDKKPTEKEKKIETQLKLGGNYVDPKTGFSTGDSLMAGGAFTPERFKAPKKEKSNLDQILEIGKKIENINNNKVLTLDEKKQYKKDLKAQADSLKATDPIAIKRDSLIKALSDTLKTPVKIKQINPFKVLKSLNKEQRREVKRLVHNIQSANPKMRKKDRLEKALKELEHIK